MVMKPEPLVASVEAVPRLGNSMRILLTPQGERFTQRLAHELAGLGQLILICGRYEGIDERARALICGREISVGDYVTSGGEIPAMIICDAVIRLVPGVLGNDESVDQESFESNLLEYPQYTRPEEFRGMKVPEVLLSGNHARIEAWRRGEAIARTAKRRPDLLERADLTEDDRRYLKTIRNS